MSSGDAVGVSLWVLDLDHFPSSVQVLNRMLDVDSLNSGHVSTSRVGNSTEDVDVFVVELATGVVVSALVQLREHVPRVGVAIVDLAFPGGSIDFLAGACDNNEVVGEAAG